MSRLGYFVARHRERFVVRKLAGLCRRYLCWYANVGYDLARNGEGFVLDTLANFSPRVIVDVGANVGDWSLAAAARCPAANIHALEISPPTFDRLRAATAAHPRVRCHNLGLSDAPGTISIRHYPDHPALTTATDYPHPFRFVELPAQVARGDEFAANHNLDHIDLLKLDVEGMERQVLTGFAPMFARGAIDVVQFEYGRVNILNGFLLRNVYEFFNAQGFEVGKIYPTFVDFRSYTLADEDFLGPNYLACRRERGDYLKALQRGGGRR
jgi:FkbM family methyltransferase